MREPLEGFLDGHGIGAGESRPSGSARATRTSPSWCAAATRASCCGARRARRCRPAHDVLREARLLRALEGTPRVPKVLAVGDDESVLGVPFYVMEEVHGSVLASSVPGALDTPRSAAANSEELVDALVEVHDVDWRACGLEGYGKPTGYLERQLRRFTGLWEHNKTRELEVVEELGDWLRANMPESPESTIVHGDYRLGT